MHKTPMNTKTLMDTKIPMDTRTLIGTEDTEDIHVTDASYEAHETKEFHDANETNDLEDVYEAQDIKGTQSELPIGKITALVNDLGGLFPIEVVELSEMIQNCVPTSFGKLYKQVFYLARGLKSLPFLSEYCEKDCKPIVRLWHGLALPFLSRKSFDDTWGEFCTGWGNVNHPLGQDFLSACIKEAEALACPELESQYDTPETICILKLCYVMQKNSEKDHFFLSCRTCGGACGLDFQLARKRLKILLADGWLELVDRGNRREAAQYRFVGELPVA